MSVRKREWVTGKGEARTAWVVDYVDGKGVRRLKTFKLKKAADAFAASAHVEVRQGVHIADRDSVTVEEAGQLWVADAESRGLERSTVHGYRQRLNDHIVPFIGSEKLSRLTVPNVRAFEDKLREEGRSPALIRMVMVSLGSLLADAAERGLAAKNPVREMRGRRKRKAGNGTDKRHKRKLKVGVDIPSPEEIKALIRALHRFPKWRPVMLTAIFTGLRASELRGLRWCDVDLERREFHVRQRADRFGEIGSPKSEAGERTVPLPPPVVTTLREWKLAYPRPVIGRDEKGKPVREAAKPEHLVFPNGQGHDEPLTNILRRGLWPACVTAGLTVPATKNGEPVLDKDGKAVVEAKYSMHALRHFYASWCINRTADGGLALPPKVVQERLGHSTIALTMDVYSHLFPRGDDADELAAAASALLG
jgi:integrase